MIRLTQPTTDLLRVSASSTNAIQITVSYSEKTATAYTGKTAVLAKTTTAIETILGTPGASTSYDVDHVMFYCATANTLTPSVTVSGTAYPFGAFALSAGDSLEYTHANGWKVLDSAGATKYALGGNVSATTLSVSGDSTLTGDLAVNGGDLTTTATTFNLLAANATTVNAFGAASVALNIGNASAAAALVGGATIPTGKSLTLVGTANLGGSGTATISEFSTASVGALTATTGTFSDTVLMRKDSNGVARFTARNDTSGTAAQAQIGAQISNFTAYNLLGVASAGYTSAGLTVASGGYLVSSGNSAGLNIFTQDNTQLTLGTNDVARLSITGAGAVTIPGTLALTATASPTGAGTGAVGQIAWDTAYLYICTAVNDWRRVALTDF